MRRSHGTPEPRSIGPLKPQSIASSALNTPMSTVRWLKMRFSVSSASTSSRIFGKVSQNAAMSSREPGRQVEGDAARAEIGRVQPRARDPLVELHELLALLEHPEERRHGADIERERRDVQQVIENAADLGIEHADVLAALGHLEAEQLLDAKREGVLLVHRRDIVEPVEIGHRLQVGLVLDQLLGAAMQEPDMRIGALDDLAVHLQHEAQARRGPPDAAARNSW